MAELATSASRRAAGLLLLSAVILLIPSWAIADAASCGGRHATIVGTPGNDHLVGKRASDVIYGGPGDDVIKGGRGYDTLFGEGGDDTLHGEFVFYRLGDRGGLHSFASRPGYD